jgi:hypothetical protein
MGKRVSIRHKRREAPEWIFNWRRPGNPALSKIFAILVAGGLFALLLNNVRIRVAAPATWAAPKATVIHVSDDAEGRALTQRAREGGPFPSRFLPSEWEGAADLERAAMAAARWTPPPYVPALRDLPDEAAPPLRLAARGVAVLPKRLPAAPGVPVPVKLRLAPVLYPLSGIGAAEIPRDLPPIDGAAVDAAMIAETWRFLVRLDAAGHVWDCVSLVGGDEADPSAIEKWLRRVTFNPEPGKPSRWIAVAIAFSNQPAADGTDAR